MPNKTKSAKAEKTVVKPSVIESEVNSFVTKMYAFHDVVPMLIGLAEMNYRSKLTNLQKFMKKSGTPVKGRKGVVKIKGPVNLNRFDQIEKEYFVARDTYNLTLESYFVAMLTTFDGFLYNVVKELLRVYPQRLNSSSKTLTYADILKYESVLELQDDILEKELEEFTSRGLEKQLDWLKDEFGVHIEPEPDLWKNLIEISERRNLIVHCDGRVSKKYLDVCKKKEIILEPENVLGYKPVISKKYFLDSSDYIFEFGVKLVHVLWRTVIPNENDISDENMVDGVCFNLLKRERYDLVIKLLKVAKEDFKFKEDICKRICHLNYALALKYTGKKEEALKLINDLDWSSSVDYLVLGVEVINENYLKAAEIMKKMGKSTEVSELEYSIWPVFRDFRKTSEFLNAFKSIYGKEFSDISSDSSSEEIVS